MKWRSLFRAKPVEVSPLVVDGMKGQVDHDAITRAVMVHGRLCILYGPQKLGVLWIDRLGKLNTYEWSHN